MKRNGDPSMEPTAQPTTRALGLASRLAGIWALGYGLYRLYYAAGGNFGMLGTPRSHEQFRLINLIAAALLFIAAALPIALLSWWRKSGARVLMLALCWVAAVGCISHGVFGFVQRILSLAGLLTIDYPFWQTIDGRQADLQDLFFNEPWFLIEGLLWVSIAWAGALHQEPRRALWIYSMIAAVAALTAIGLLSAFGVIPKVIIG